MLTTRRILVLFITGLALASCGGPPAPAGQIRANFARLRTAFQERDARTVCELLFFFGEHQPVSALQAELRTLQTSSERSRYEADVERCVPGLVRDASSFRYYARSFGALAIRDVRVRGDIATVRLVNRRGPSVTVQFVHAAAEWRLLYGVQ